MGLDQNIITRKKWKQLSEQERYRIEHLIKEKLTARQIAERMGRDRRTIEREIKRGTVIQRDSEWRDRARYLADAGQRVKRENAANKGRPLKIGNCHALVRYIEQKIGKEKWSPDAVLGEIKTKGLKFAVTICTKTLYNYIDARLFLNISNQDLAVKKAKKKRGYRKTRTVALNNTKGRSIEERAKGIEEREEYGHWEMDCVLGKGRACLLVMTERKSREELIFKLENKTQAAVVKAIDQLEHKHKKQFSKRFKSITMDNGSEFLDMSKLEESCLQAKNKRTTCYYAHPYSAWERGSNENANKLIRRFVPKGTDIDKLTVADVKRIERWMNNYPRRMFNYKTPNEIKAAS